MTGMKVDKALNYVVGVFVYNMVAKLRKESKNHHTKVYLQSNDTFMGMCLGIFRFVSKYNACSMVCATPIAVMASATVV